MTSSWLFSLLLLGVFSYSSCPTTPMRPPSRLYVDSFGDRKYVYALDANNSVSSSKLTHLPLVPHICVSVRDHHWLRKCPVAYSAPSHYLNQCRLTANWTHRNKLLSFSFKKIHLIHFVQGRWVNTHPGQNGHHFADDIFEYIFVYSKFFILSNFTEVCSRGSNCQ